LWWLLGTLSTHYSVRILGENAMKQKMKTSKKHYSIQNHFEMADRLQAMAMNAPDKTPEQREYAQSLMQDAHDHLRQGTITGASYLHTLK